MSKLNVDITCCLYDYCTAAAAIAADNTFKETRYYLFIILLWSHFPWSLMTNAKLFTVVNNETIQPGGDQRLANS